MALVSSGATNQLMMFKELICQVEQLDSYCELLQVNLRQIFICYHIANVHTLVAEKYQGMSLYIYKLSILTIVIAYYIELCNKVKENFFMVHHLC